VSKDDLHWTRDPLLSTRPTHQKKPCGSTPGDRGRTCEWIHENRRHLLQVAPILVDPLRHGSTCRMARIHIERFRLSIPSWRGSGGTRLGSGRAPPSSFLSVVRCKEPADFPHLTADEKCRLRAELGRFIRRFKLRLAWI
jgi:hypothetical protein